MASVVAFLAKYFFSHELRLKTFYHPTLILETDHLLLGSKLTEYGTRVLSTLRPINPLMHKHPGWHGVWSRLSPKNETTKPLWGWGSERLKRDSRMKNVLTSSVRAFFYGRF